MTTTPAGHEPNRPTEDGPLAPTAPGTAPHLTLTRPQKILIAIVGAGVLTIATLGFIGSYAAVTDLAEAKHFGNFAQAFPIAVDAGIIAFLALDLLLTWLRMTYPLLRYGAWLLTAATIAFNAVTAWPDPIGVGMHAVIPLLFVIAVEAARHAIGRIADITADKHIEGPNISRWFLNPIGTFILWRRQRLWGIRKWDQVLELERERRIYIGQLRKKHGRTWRRLATAEELLVLRLAKDGMSVTEAIALPAREEEKRRKEQERIARDKRQAEDQRRREQEQYEADKRRKDDEYKREQQRLEDERRRQEEDQRLERERKALELDKQRREAARLQQIADAEAKARLEEIERQKRQAAEDDAARRRREQEEADRRLRQEQLEHARRIADQQQRAAEAAKARKDAEEKARIEAERKAEAARRAAEMLRAANASDAARPASASGTSASRPASPTPASASPIASAASGATDGTASPTATSPASATASATATSGQPANASTSQDAATSASTVDIDQVVDVYQLLKEQLGKAPSDQKLGEALGVSRSRAQQLRTLAIQAGHTELAKPMRIAS
ncbi:DUF2637 domain-containing protein [Streptomyces sp. DHE17-7]|uniref:DUF2637 domain-containing protein n=1 Tax=Streptomyces sp. DHE17-7 TaxID=2759949 RepID=UPI0022EA7112|nr:DUF2637 domain-containing protein [Streptomyces sp. DHE17-7]